MEVSVLPFVLGDRVPIGMRNRGLGVDSTNVAELASRLRLLLLDSECLIDPLDELAVRRIGFLLDGLGALRYRRRRNHLNALYTSSPAELHQLALRPLDLLIELWIVTHFFSIPSSGARVAHIRRPR